MNNYNVYVIIDPRYFGPFKYGEYNFQSLPIYIGKGKRNKRRFDHFRKCDLDCNTNRKKSNILKKLLKLGYHKEELSYIIKDNLFESEAYELEINLIKNIGRFDGPLTNMTDGGDGAPGKKISEIHRNILKQRMKGNNNPNFGKTKELNSFYNKNHTEETKKIMSLKKKGCRPNCKPHITYDWFIINENEIKLIDLKSFCKENDINYLDVYSRFRNNETKIKYKKKWLFFRKLK